MSVILQGIIHTGDGKKRWKLEFAIVQQNFFLTFAKEPTKTSHKPTAIRNLYESKIRDRSDLGEGIFSITPISTKQKIAFCKVDTSKEFERWLGVLQQIAKGPFHGNFYHARKKRFNPFDPRSEEEKLAAKEKKIAKEEATKPPPSPTKVADSKPAASKPRTLTPVPPSHSLAPSGDIPLQYQPMPMYYPTMQYATPQMAYPMQAYPQQPNAQPYPQQAPMNSAQPVQYVMRPDGTIVRK